MFGFMLLIDKKYTYDFTEEAANKLCHMKLSKRQRHKIKEFYDFLKENYFSAVLEKYKFRKDGNKYMIEICPTIGIHVKLRFNKFITTNFFKIEHEHKSDSKIVSFASYANRK